MNELAKLIATRRILKQDRLELRTRLAEIHSAYLNDGVRTAPEVRASLKARITRIELELNRLDAEIASGQVGVKRATARSLLSHLTILLREQALDHLIEQARQRTDAEAAELEAEGLREAWSADERQEVELRAELERRLAEPLPEPIEA